MIDGRASQTAAKVVLAVVTIVLLLSQIGFLLVPVLLPAHVWAARRSGRIGRVGWSFLPAVGLATAAWGALYLTVGESKPAIWLVPLAALVVAFVLLRRFAVPDRTISTAI